jgi:hypothetical protein
VDFIERLFHISPDGGNGVTELAYILIPLIVALVLYVTRQHRLRSRNAK